MADGRKYYFDIAKGIGIFLVVMGHLEYISEATRYFIVSFHMPMFFVISGMLMYMIQEEKKEPAAFLKGKLRRMGLPYLSFSILYLIIEVIYGQLTGTFNMWVWVQDIWLSVCLYGNSVLWFLPAMYFAMIGLYFMRRKMSHRATIVTVILLTIAAYFLNIGLEQLNAVHGLEFVFSEVHFILVMLLRNVFALMYLAAGYYGYMLVLKIRPKFSVITKNAAAASVAGLIFSAVLLIGVWYMAQANGAVDIHFLIFGNPFIYLFTSLAGSAAIICLSRILEPLHENVIVKAICFYGRNSLTVMATHINTYLLYISIIVSMHFSKYITHAKHYVFCLMVLVFVFVGEAVMILVINKFCPVFTGMVKK